MSRYVPEVARRSPTGRRDYVHAADPWSQTGRPPIDRVRVVVVCHRGWVMSEVVPKRGEARDDLATGGRMLRVIVVTHFESRGLQRLRVADVLLVRARRAARIRRPDGRAGPDAPCRVQPEIAKQAVHALAVFDGLAVWVVEDRERESFAARPAQGRHRRPR